MKGYDTITDVKAAKAARYQPLSFDSREIPSLYLSMTPRVPRLR